MVEVAVRDVDSAVEASGRRVDVGGMASGKMGVVSSASHCGSSWKDKEGTCPNSKMAAKIGTAPQK